MNGSILPHLAHDRKIIWDPCTVCLISLQHSPSPRHNGIKPLGKCQSQLSSPKLLIQHCLYTDFSEVYERWNIGQETQFYITYTDNWNEQPCTGMPYGSRIEKNLGRIQKQEDWGLPWTYQRGWEGVCRKGDNKKC